MTCCICMDEFTEKVVILPCKAHFFHENCIAKWMEKQNVCPVCRHEVTVDGLKRQGKELEKLLKSIKKDEGKKAGADEETLL